tara:strand:- start:1006 stop:1695 length:690 start_codon:yes stop_codon:yes gene_type:complete
VIDPGDVHEFHVDSEVWRIIPSRYPQIDLFERVSSPAEFDLLYQIESLTNPRLRDDVGDMSRVAREDIVSGNGASWIMAAFTHPPQVGQGGRFNKDFGVYYCALNEDVAVAETLYHRKNFFQNSGIDNETADMRVIRASVDKEFHDVRQFEDADIYHPDNYYHSQVLGERLRNMRSYGVLYKSVRKKGECIAVMRPKAITEARHIRFIRYHFQVGLEPRVEILDGGAGV